MSTTPIGDFAVRSDRHSAALVSRDGSMTSAFSRKRSTPINGELLGNFPQAFSHIGLVNTAWAISEAETPR